MTRKGPAENKLVRAGFLLLAIAACVSAVVFLSQFGKSDEQIPFEAEGWHAPISDRSGFTGTRLKMVDDLLARYDFHDWSRQDLQDLLGDPYLERIEEQKHILKYDLRDGLNLLIFEIDSRHKVVDYHLWRYD